ncbi:uncharacterized protein LOC134668055 [Cydia fagiglandana]|uniref:uncharacterized protein LOC134668055 n=1 Tax=Cydia fagiglandana TaxID=1458189 RepID=UPI002FEE4730
MSNTCSECERPVKPAEKLICTRCDSLFHFLCVNVTAAVYKKTNKTNWTYENCTKQPNHDRTGTPKKAFENTDFSAMIRNEVREALRAELPIILRQHLEAELTPIKEELKKLQDSVSFMSNQYDDIHPTMTTLNNDIKTLNSERNELLSTITGLTDRLNQIEQHMRDCNVEIQGIPEDKNENLVNTIQHIAEVVSCSMSDVDILHCTRVASQNKENKKPRTIIAKLRSTRCRDELLSAVGRFNKTKARDQKLNSSVLGIGGPAVPIYVSEHLSPVNKTLHWAARKKATELSYKYVWVRNGSVFMRKDDNSRYIIVKTQQTLDSLQ